MIYQVVEVEHKYVDGFDGDHEWDEDVNMGYYSTKEKAEARLEILTKEFWDEEYGCMRDFEIREIMLDTDINN